MPESNGKRNWTVMLCRADSTLFDDSAVTFERTEYYDRARYEADRLRYLIGETDKQPDLWDYDPDIKEPRNADDTKASPN